MIGNDLGYEHTHDYVMMTPLVSSYREESAPSPVPIDRKLAPIMECVWALGLETYFCCEGDDLAGLNGTSDADIMFSSMTHAELFATMATRGGEVDIDFLIDGNGNENDPSAVRLLFRHRDIERIAESIAYVKGQIERLEATNKKGVKLDAS